MQIDRDAALFLPGNGCRAIHVNTVRQNDADGVSGVGTKGGELTSTTGPLFHHPQTRNILLPFASGAGTLDKMSPSDPSWVSQISMGQPFRRVLHDGRGTQKEKEQAKGREIRGKSVVGGHRAQRIQTKNSGRGGWWGKTT